MSGVPFLGPKLLFHDWQSGPAKEQQWRARQGFVLALYERREISRRSSGVSKSDASQTRYFIWFLPYNLGIPRNTRHNGHTPAWQTRSSDFYKSNFVLRKSNFTKFSFLIQKKKSIEMQHILLNVKNISCQFSVSKGTNFTFRVFHTLRFIFLQST